MVTDKKIDKSAFVNEKVIGLRMAPASSLTQVPVWMHKPGVPFTIVGIEDFCRAETGAVDYDVRIVKPDGLITHAALGIGTTATKFKLTRASYYLAAGVLKTKAITDELTFSAAHKVTANLWGAILIQIDSAGAVSTKVVAATQGYVDEATAKANLPAADAGKIALGSISLRAEAGADWDANTDNLSVGVGGTQATNYNDASPVSALSAPLAAFATLTFNKKTLAAQPNGDQDYSIIVVVTTDGSGALTDGFLNIRYRRVGVGNEGTPSFS